MADPTLAELAAQQQANGNPWLSGSASTPNAVSNASGNVSAADSDWGGPTQNQTAMAQQNAAATDALANKYLAAGGSQITPTTPGTPGTPGTPTAPAGVAGMPVGGAAGTLDANGTAYGPLTQGGGVNALTGQLSPALAAPKATGIGGGLTPDRQLYNTEQDLRGQEAGLLDKNAETQKAVKDVYQTGEAEAQRALKSATARDILNQSQLASLQRSTNDLANRRQIELEKQAEAVRAMKIDPSHWYKQAGTAGSILSAIAIGAGAFAAAMPHTASHQNFALDIIDKSIQRDIDSQHENIEKAWQAVNFKGTEDQKQYVRDQFFVNQKREAGVTDYDHALAQIAQVRTKTTNQAAIQNMDMLTSDIEKKKLDLKDQGAQQMYHVQLSEAARAAAAYGQSPAKKYLEYANEVDKGNIAHPDKPVLKLPYDDWKVQNYGGQGAAAPDATGGNGNKSADIKSGLNAVAAVGKGASDAATLGNAFTSMLPALVAPGANMAADKVNFYNESYLPGLIKSTEPRLDQKQIEEQMKTLRLSAGMSQEQRLARIKLAQTKLASNLALRGQDNTGVPDEVAGAKPLGE